MIWQAHFPSPRLFKIKITCRGLRPKRQPKNSTITAYPLTFTLSNHALHVLQLIPLFLSCLPRPIPTVFVTHGSRLSQRVPSLLQCQLHILCHDKRQHTLILTNSLSNNVFIYQQKLICSQWKTTRSTFITCRSARWRLQHCRHKFLSHFPLEGLCVLGEGASTCIRPQDVHFEQVNAMRAIHSRIQAGSLVYKGCRDAYGRYLR
jgi:hypothetical protein